MDAAAGGKTYDCNPMTADALQGARAAGSLGTAGTAARLRAVPARTFPALVRG